MIYEYSVNIQSVDGLPVVEEDIQIALMRSGQEGPDIDVWPTGEEGYFTIEADEEINLASLKAELERMDTVLSCEAKLDHRI